ncbi:MAG: PAS domain-containing protein [Halomonas sp.]|uniref:PAS domain-containing protein n=1 Tax=Halomonas sp. TaxID=1486246 RepID=UPI00287022AC|nr:PAS domain-containing protein [Halomonas sp.]MDR9438380.1 PAS domain-containing protein [Halomonas sp.]
MSRCMMGSRCRYRLPAMAMTALGLLGAAVWVPSRLLGGMLLVTALGLFALSMREWRLRARTPSHPDDEWLRQTRRGEGRFRAMLESLPNIAVQGYDRHRRVIFWNEESTRLYGYRYDEVHGRRLEELIIPDAMRAQVVRDHDIWIREGRAIPPGRLVLRDRDGQPVPVYSYHVMLDEHTADPVMFCVDVPLDRDASCDPPPRID